MRELCHRLQAFGLVPVIKITDAAKAAALGRTLREGGLPVAEITLRTPQALAAITRMRDAEPDLLIGAGTVLTAEQAEAALDAGADFIVSPCLAPEVFAFCKGRGVAAVPGVFTPSELHQALAMGAGLMKLFPAELGGVGLVKSYGAVFGEIKLMPTGGVGEANLAEFLAVPQVVCCGGSYVAPAGLIADGNFPEIEQRVRRTVDIVAAARST